MIERLRDSEPIAKPETGVVAEIGPGFMFFKA
jgi:hypothetical protein